MNKYPLIQLKNIYKTYDTGQIKFTALKNINLTINAGEYTAILGPSGSGKSTLMQIVGCLSTPSSGSYLLEDKEVAHLNRNELANVRNRKIGFVFQNFNLLNHLDIVDNVALPLVYRGTAIGKRQQLARAILTKLGLQTHFKHKPNELSGGQQQRVAIARALITEPQVILADEPTGNLDTQSGQDVINIFEQFASEGKTVIIVTHDLTIAKRTQRIIHIQDGKLTEEEFHRSYQ